MSQPGDAVDPFRDHDSGPFCSATIYHAASEAWGYTDSHGCLQLATRVLPSGEKLCESHFRRRELSPETHELTRRIGGAA